MELQSKESTGTKAIRQPIVTVAGHVDHGKCVSGDTLIPLVDGSLISAEELFKKHYDASKAKKHGTDVFQEIRGLKLFSNYGQVILPSEVSHIWKRQKKELIEIKTSHGDVIKTTPEHPYFKFSCDSPVETKAEEIKEGDYIAIPKQLKFLDKNPKEIIFEKLKENNFLCFLNIDSKQLLDKIRKKGISFIEKTLSIKHLGDSLRKARIRFQDLVKICRYFNIAENEIYNFIWGIKNSSETQRAGHTSKVVKLPDFHNFENFGYILGCICGDGHLGKTQVILNNNDREIQEKYSEYLKEIFGLECITKQGHTCQITVDNGGLTFKRFLMDLIGIPDKNKSSKIEVPIIAQSNSQIFRGFLAGLLDTDGYVSHINHSIEITSKSKNLIKQCSILLLNFGILSTVFQKSGFYYLRISNKKYLDKFLDNINPRLKRKLERIITASEKAQSSRIFDIFPIPKEELKSLNLISKINKKIPYFSKYIKNPNFTESFLLNTLKNIRRENPTSHKIRALLNAETRYVKVISKRKIKNKEKYVYDFTVPETHNFIAERTIVHNTSILDNIRKSVVQGGEAGGITQKISFTLFPRESILKRCPIINKKGIALEIPGFLFIDTPGHAAFSNLRKRGGALADLAILVIDINEGIKPQTAEVIQILKLNKTPFVIALNKIDNISGWKTAEEGKSVVENINLQAVKVKQEFEEKMLTLVGSLYSHGFKAAPFYEVKDFSKELALVPCSGRTGEGIEDLSVALCGLSQKFLRERLLLGKECKGVILEIKKEKSINYLEAIVYDGVLHSGDEIAIASFDEPIFSKIRILEEILPVSSKFKAVKEAKAATGVRIQLKDSMEVLPGMPFRVITKEKSKEETVAELKKEVGEKTRVDKQGIIIKADSLGSLEALMVLLRQENIKICKAGIGNIDKKDVISANANLENDECDAVILGFNVDQEEDTKELDLSKIKIIKNEVVYKLIEAVTKYREEKRKQLEKQKLLGLASVCKLKVLSQYVFHNSNPAIFGVKIVGGRLRAGTPVMGEDGVSIGKIGKVQEDKKSVDEASIGMEVAVSLSGVNFERQIGEKEFLYSDLGEGQFREFKKNKNLLTSDEVDVLQKVAQIKRAGKPTWGV